jgi:hypothetical protein
VTDTKAVHEFDLRERSLVLFGRILKLEKQLNNDLDTKNELVQLYPKTIAAIFQIVAQYFPGTSIF